MAKDKDNNELNEVELTIEGQYDSEEERADQQPEDKKPKKKHLSEKDRLTSALKKIRNKTSEGDDAPSGSLRLRDILGGDYLWMLVRNQIGLLILIVFITTAYIAMRYQCQQDVIDINALEKQLVEAKFKAMSNSSNLTRQCRQSNVLDLLRASGDTTLTISQHLPYFVEVPDEK